MTKFIIETNIDYDSSEVVHIEEIFLALIKSGSLTGVKGGQSILHFDKDGVFQGIELDYWPWRRREKLDKNLI